MECCDHIGQDQDKCGYCELISDHDREIARLTAERDLLKNWQDHNANEVPRLKMQIESLIAERDQARAEAAAAYERAAKIVEPIGMRHPANQYGETMRRFTHEIRALDPDATAALAEMLDAETRACAEVCNRLVHAKQQRHGYKTAWGAMGCREAILSRIDQRKEAGK